MFGNQTGGQSSGGGSGGGLIGAGVQVGGQLLNSHFNRRTARRNTDLTIGANKSEAELAWQRSLDMWHMQNQYNDPSAQMQRFKRAGLNPNLVYGQGTSGNSSKTPEYKAAQQEHKYKAFKVPELTKFQEVRLQDQQISAIKQSTDLDAAKETNEMIKSTILDNVRKKGDLDVNYLESLYPYNLQAKQKSIEKQSKDINLSVQKYNLGKKDFPIKDQILKYQKGQTSRVWQEAYNKKLINDWMEQGITPQDNILFRMMQRVIKSPMEFLGGKKNKNPFTF